MEKLNSNSFDYEIENPNLQNIQFEIVEDELLSVQRATVQVYEQA